MNNKQKPIYDSSKQVSHAITELIDLWHYRYLIKLLVKRDVTTRYKRSVLGVIWTMLNPLMTMIIMSLVFSTIFKSTNSYAVYVLSGFLIWNFYSQVSLASISGLVWGGSIIKQIYLPRTIFAVSALGTGLVNFLLSIVPLLLVMIVTKASFGWPLLFLPISILIVSGFTLGIGLLVSSLAVYFPDVSEMYNIVLIAWMYLTPLVYPEEIIPQQYLHIYRLNPMYLMVRLIRLPVWMAQWPTWNDVWPALVYSLTLLILGWFVFTARSDEYAYRV